MPTAATRNPAQNTERQNTVVHGSVETRRTINPPVLQKMAAVVTSHTPRRRLPVESGAITSHDHSSQREAFPFRYIGAPLPVRGPPPFQEPVRPCIQTRRRSTMRPWW